MMQFGRPHELDYDPRDLHPNHFVLDRGGKVFKQTAPIIKLPQDSTEHDHLALLGLLNSSVACFWMKQVFHCKGSQGVNEGMKSEIWEQFIEHDSTKLKQFPVPAGFSPAAARMLDKVARKRAAISASVVLANGPWTDARSLYGALEKRRAADLDLLTRMVALQEELDWACYRSFGLDDGEAIDLNVEGIWPTRRPMELLLARRDMETRSKTAQKENTTESPTVWFKRHGWEPETELPADLHPRVRSVYAARLQRIAASSELSLIERPEYKRRWYRPDYTAEERAALETWLLDRVESEASAHQAPRTARQHAAALQADPRALAVAELYVGRQDFDLQQVVAKMLEAESVPQHPILVYSAKGLEKRAVWEQTWADQRREDAGEAVTPEVPPTYSQADFAKARYYALRGKLDVPKERFIALTEVPRAEDEEPLFGWAGWSPARRVRAILDLDEKLDDAGILASERIALLDSAWRLLPAVDREDGETAGRTRAELAAIVGEFGPSADVVERCLLPTASLRE